MPPEAASVCVAYTASCVADDGSDPLMEIVGQTTLNGTFSEPGQPLASVTLSPIVVLAVEVGVPINLKFTPSHDIPAGMPVGAAKE